MHQEEAERFHQINLDSQVPYHHFYCVFTIKKQCTKQHRHQHQHQQQKWDDTLIASGHLAADRRQTALEALAAEVKVLGTGRTEEIKIEIETEVTEVGNTAPARPSLGHPRQTDVVTEEEREAHQSTAPVLGLQTRSTVLARTAVTGRTGSEETAPTAVAATMAPALVRPPTTAPQSAPTRRIGSIGSASRTSSAAMSTTRTSTLTSSRSTWRS